MLQVAYKYIIFAWIAIFAIMAIFAIRLPSMLKATASEWTGNIPAVMDIVSETFDMPAETMLLVFDNVDDEKISSTIEEIEKLG